MRLDKFLKVSRIIKRRTIADEACKAGKVAVNGKTAKSSYDIKEEDIIELSFGEKILKVRVEKVIEHTTKETAGDLYTVL